MGPNRFLLDALVEIIRNEERYRLSSHTNLHRLNQPTPRSLGRLQWRQQEYKDRAAVVLSQAVSDASRPPPPRSSRPASNRR